MLSAVFFVFLAGAIVALQEFVLIPKTDVCAPVLKIDVVETQVPVQKVEETGCEARTDCN